MVVGLVPGMLCQRGLCLRSQEPAGRRAEARLYQCAISDRRYSCFKANVNFGAVTSAAKADSSSALECTPERRAPPKSCPNQRLAHPKAAPLTIDLR